MNQILLIKRKRKDVKIKKYENKKSQEQDKYFISHLNDIFLELIKIGEFKKLKRITNLLFQNIQQEEENEIKRKDIYFYLPISLFKNFNKLNDLSLENMIKVFLNQKEKEEEEEERFISYFLILILKSISENEESLDLNEILKVLSKTNKKNKIILNIFLFDWLQLIKEKRIRFYFKDTSLKEIEFFKIINQKLEKKRLNIISNEKEIKIEFDLMKEKTKEEINNIDYLKFISKNKIKLNYDFLKKIISLFEFEGLNLKLNEDKLLLLIEILIQNKNEFDEIQIEICYKILKRIFLKWYFHKVSGKSFEFLDSSKYFNSKNDQLLHGSLLYKLFYNLNPLFENELNSIFSESITKPIRTMNIKYGNESRDMNQNDTKMDKLSYTFVFIISSYINRDSKLFFNFLFSNFSNPSSIEMIGICNCIEKIPYQFKIFKNWISKILNILIFEIFEFEKLKRMNDDHLNENELISSLINVQSLFFKIQGIFTKSLCYLSKKDIILIKLILNNLFNFIKELNDIWFKYLKKGKGKLNKSKKIIILLKYIYPTFFEILSNLEFNLIKEEENSLIISILSYLDFLKDRNINHFLKENLIQHLNLNNLNNIIIQKMNQFDDNLKSLQFNSLINFYLNFFILLRTDWLKNNENLIKFTFKCLNENSNTIILTKSNDLFLLISTDELIPYYLNLCFKKGGILYSLFLKYFPEILKSASSKISIYSINKISDLFFEKLKKKQISKSILLLLLNLTQSIQLNTLDYLLEIIEKVYSTIPSSKSFWLKFLYEVVANSRDYTRKQKLLYFYLNLSNKYK
eukprot:gene3469-6118_t